MKLYCFEHFEIRISGLFRVSELEFRISWLVRVKLYG